MKTFVNSIAQNFYSGCVGGSWLMMFDYGWLKWSSLPRRVGLNNAVSVLPLLFADHRSSPFREYDDTTGLIIELLLSLLFTTVESISRCNLQVSAALLMVIVFGWSMDFLKDTSSHGALSLKSALPLLLFMFPSRMPSNPLPRLDAKLVLDLNFFRVAFIKVVRLELRRASARHRLLPTTPFTLYLALRFALKPLEWPRFRSMFLLLMLQLKEFVVLMVLLLYFLSMISYLKYNNIY